MDPPNRRKRPHPPPCSPWVKQREYLEVLSRLRRCCPPVLLTVSRTPRWIRNPTLPDASTGSSSKTVHGFQKMTAMASNGPTSQMQYLNKFHCGFFRLRNDYLRNKSVELVMSALFSMLGRLLSSEQITSRKGIVTVLFEYFASDSVGWFSRCLCLPVVLE